MNDEEQQAIIDCCLIAFKGNEHAVLIALGAFVVANLWDDLIDKDRGEIPPSEINEAFKILIYDIPRNPFYIKHQHDLSGLMMNIILQWHDANALEETDDADDRNKAYMLRAGLYNLISHIAFLIGGYQWAQEVGPSIRRLYGEKLEDFDAHTG